MRRTLAVVLVLVGCGGDEVRPAQAPEDGRAAQLRAEQAKGSAMMQALAQQATAAQAARDQASDASMAKGQAMAADLARVQAEQRAATEAASKARADVVAEDCKRTRPTRAAEAQADVRAYVAWLKRIGPVMQSIHASCKVVLKNTGAMNVTSTGHGWRVAPEQREAIACAGGIPRGVTEDDVAVLLSRLGGGRENAPVVTAPRGQCEALDGEAGLDTQVVESDSEGLKRLLAWKP